MENIVLSDPALLERARQFDRQALAEIYDLYSPGLYRYAMRLLGDPNLAEECVAETFSRFLHALSGHKGPRDYVQAYLYRVAHNWIADLFRRDPPPEELTEDRPDTGLSPETAAEQDMHDARLRAAIRRLTPDQQQVILLKYGEDWDNEAVARALQKPAGAIKSLQHRALARLQQILNEEIS
ncbi:MAG: sigma-70 family RNA polymerase sigma factor [Chloroflexi bacterium]|nr:sigma-70 family RNA polymerase sigma factor [Chloroflexota bacterium]